MYSQNVKVKEKKYKKSYTGRVYEYKNYRHNKPQKNPVSFIKILCVFILWVLILAPALYVNYSHFLAPVYLYRFLNSSLTFNAEKIYKPYLSYINNSYFMGQNLLVSSPKKGKEKILKINSLGENYEIKSKIQKILKEYPNLHAGIYIYDYLSAKTVEINSSEVFETASIIKIPILFELFNLSKHLENEGFMPIDLDKTIEFKESHRTEGSGELQYSDAGKTYSLDYLAKIMIRKSDNSATNILIEELGGINSINSSLRSWGFPKTQIGNWLPDLEGENKTTPEDMATMLYNLDNVAFMPRKYSSVIKEIMSKVENRTLIRSQVPDSALLVHKTGDIGKMLGDAGIIYTPQGKKYIMVILVKRPHNDYSARELIQKVSKVVYDNLGA